MKKRSIDADLMVLVEAMAQTMKFAVQALNQSTALAEVLILKGVVTKTELDEEIKKHRDVTNKLTEVLNIFAGKPKGKPN